MVTKKKIIELLFHTLYIIGTQNFFIILSYKSFISFLKGTFFFCIDMQMMYLFNSKISKRSILAFTSKLLVLKSCVKLYTLLSRWLLLLTINAEYKINQKCKLSNREYYLFYLKAFKYLPIIRRSEKISSGTEEKIITSLEFNC